MPRGPTFSDVEIETMRRLFSTGKSVRAVADVMGRSTSAIQRQMKKFEIASINLKFGATTIGKDGKKYVMVAGKLARKRIQD